MSFVLFIAVLVVLIVVHELGHFLVAKFFGIKVDEFGIGYPPRAFTIGKLGDTVYTINWLPFGGFVKIFGESLSQQYSKEDKKRAFVHKPKLVQATVLIAGVVFNLLFAWFLFSVTLMMGAPTAIDESQAVGLDTRLIVSSVVTGSPADAVGLVSGDEIVGLVSRDASLETLFPSNTATFIQDRAGETITVSYIRDAETGIIEDVELIPAHGVLSETPSTPAVGIAMALVADKSLPIGQAVAQGFMGTMSALKTVSIGLGGFLLSAVTASADWSQVAGPIGIAGLVGDASSVGFTYLLYFTAFISVNLAVINMIPLPALDGGRLLFIAIEVIIRKPISEKIGTVFNVVGFTLLIVLMVVVTYHDIIRLFS
ncbi:MAG: site-2 protease family protein [Candidatus Pacebacteria bacterium]|nr:site-2 protease family protein [Candidatus Paceibacterota bacterium]